jgi:hypothetical protein
MVMQEIGDSVNERFEGGQYARTEEELYEKAIALLEKCKIEPRRSGQEIPESESDS